MNTLFADGSVRFVKSGINQLTWMSIGSIDGGEVVSSDSYSSAKPSNDDQANDRRLQQ